MLALHPLAEMQIGDIAGLGRVAYLLRDELCCLGWCGGIRVAKDSRFRGGRSCCRVRW